MTSKEAAWKKYDEWRARKETPRLDRFIKRKLIDAGYSLFTKRSPTSNSVYVYGYRTGMRPIAVRCSDHGAGRRWPPRDSRYIYFSFINMDAREVQRFVYAINYQPLAY